MGKAAWCRAGGCRAGGVRPGRRGDRGGGAAPQGRPAPLRPVRAALSRRWRALSLATIGASREGEPPRVGCPEHGAVVAAVPWARHGAGHTHAFDDTAAWLAGHTSQQAVHQLLGVAWATGGRRLG